jgi:hypothetical protein
VRIPRILTRIEASKLLESVGLQIGEWNEVRRVGVGPVDATTISFRSPRDAAEMLCLAERATGWLRPGAWTLLQFDNSNWLSRTENVLLSQLMFGPEVFVDFNAVENRSIVFTPDEVRRGNTDLRISAVVFAILLSEGHAYIASSASSARECLGIQDGVLHFISDMPETAATTVESFEIDRARSPQWVIDLIVEDQQ